MPQAVTRVRAVSQDVATLGEGPYWNATTGHLYYVDIPNGHATRLDPLTDQIDKITFPGRVSMIIEYENEPGNFVISFGNEIRKLNWASGVYTLIATVAPQLGGRERFNDGKCDPRGRLFIGTILDDPKGKIVPGGGSLYRLDGNTLTKVSEGYDISNGIVWNANASKMYFNDSEGRKMYAFDYDIETGTPSNRQVLIDLNDHPDFTPDLSEAPDGLTMDVFGYLWCAIWEGGRIVKIDPDTGRVVDQVMLPTAAVPTSLAWGNFQGEDGFFVTTANLGTGLSDDGKILRVDILGGEAHQFE